MEITYWRDRYFNILKQNQALNKEIQELNEALASYVQICNDQKARIAELESKQAINSIVGLSATIQQSIVSSFGLKRQTTKEHSIPSKPTQDSFTEQKQRMFENFFVLGSLPPHDQEKAEILFQYPESCNFNKNILADFAFPTGFSRSYIDMSESGTAFYSLLYRTYQRDQNSFIFTIKSNESSNYTNLDIANQGKEVLYCCAVTVVDPTSTNEMDATELPVIPKCYCLLSYFPCFELHFQVLFSLLSIKKVSRFSDLSESTVNNTMFPEDIYRIEDEQLGLLSEYYDNYFLGGSSVCITLQTVPAVECEIPNDLSLLDCEWVCPVLFSLLDFDDFFKVLCAIMHERSVVFVSSNYDYLTSCVLAYQALMRPFVWPHLISPILPDSLKEVIEAPVPIIAGITTPPERTRKYSHIVWVLLDERDIQKRVQNIGIRQREPQSNGIKEYLGLYYKFFKDRSCYESDEQKVQFLHKVVRDIKQIWLDIIGKIPKRISINQYEQMTFDEIKASILERINTEDMPFVDQMIETQYFTNFIESMLNTN